MAPLKNNNYLGTKFAIFWKILYQILLLQIEIYSIKGPI